MATLYQIEQDADTPLRRWRFEETSGTTFTDDVGALAATITASVTLNTTDPYGPLNAPGAAGDFTTGYATITGQSAVRPNTVEALIWLDTTPASASPCLFTHAFTSGQVIPAFLGFNLDNTHAQRLGFGYYTGAAFAVCHMSTALTTGVLHHVVGVYDGATTITLYVDGVSVASATVTARPGGGTVNGTAYIGRKWDSTTAIDGRIYDLALYNGSLSPTRVTAHAAGAFANAGIAIPGGGGWAVTSGPTPTPYQAAQTADSPFRRWRFEETTGSTFTDDIAGTVVTASGSVTAGTTETYGPYSSPRRGIDLAGGYASLTGTATWTALQSIEALVYLDTLPLATWRTVLFGTSYTAPQNMPLVLGFNIDNTHTQKLGFGYWDNTANAWRAVSMTTNLTTGVLHHVVGVYDGGTGLTLYVDGVNVASGTVTARITGTQADTGYIGRQWDTDTTTTLDGRVYDLALYTTGLSPTQVAAHASAAFELAGIGISGGGAWTDSDGHAVGTDQDPRDPITTGGGWNASAGQAIQNSDLIPWAGYGELSAQPTVGGVQGEWWSYTPTSSGTVAVDTFGSGWDTTVTIYAADRTTVLATNSDAAGLPGPGEYGYTGESATSLAVTAGTTYTVLVTGGSTATGSDGRYILNVAGPGTADGSYQDTPAPDFPAPPAAGPPPTGIVQNPIRQVSVSVPAPTLLDGIPQQPWPATVTESDWGYFQIVIAGIDVTYFRGVPAIIESYELQEPFGCGPATITFPKITPHDTVGTGDTNWLIGGYTAQILHAEDARPIWSGIIANQVGSYDPSGAGYTIELIGDMWAADLVGHQPRTYLPPVDLGSMVAVVLNLVPHRHYGSMTQTITGIKTTQRGSPDTSVLGYVQQLLAMATTDDGSNQWTVRRVAGGVRGAYEVALKATTVQATVRTGTPGIDVKLHLDSSTAVNRIYGRGIAPNGYAWAGWVYPVPTDAPIAYPNASPSSTLTIGSTDAGTTSGTGVTDWQTKVNSTGTATVAIDGTYDAADAAAARKIQAARGLTVDGIVGPQTWTGTFASTATSSALDSPYRAPLAALPSVTPTLTNADGSVGAANPADNTSLLVVDRDEDFGDGMTKAEATRSAKAELARTNNPGWVGEIVFRTDPPGMSRFDLVEGQRITLQGWTGRDVPLHVAQLRVSPPQGSDPGTVTATVDEKARDLMTLGAILRRDRDSARNPAMLPPKRQRRSESRPDSVVEYDGESTGGIVPKTALYGGLWTVLRIPVSQAGKVAEVRLNTYTAPSPFSVAFFGDAVTPADLLRLVGNPLADHGDYGPYDQQIDALTTLGFIEAIGGTGQAAGYDPGYQTSPRTQRATPLTGKLISTGSWTYRSARPPWLWVAVYAVNSCFISGRIFPAPIDT